MPTEDERYLHPEESFCGYYHSSPRGLSLDGKQVHPILWADVISAANSLRTDDGSEKYWQTQSFQCSDKTRRQQVVLTQGLPQRRIQRQSKRRSSSACYLEQTQIDRRTSGPCSTEEGCPHHFEKIEGKIQYQHK